MMSALFILLYGFLMGLRRGASSCLALCMPSLVPALLEEGGSWKKGVRTALWFNLPRMALLTILGFAIGAGGFYIGSSVSSVTVGSDVWTAGYVIVGSMMLIYGLYVFASADGKLEDLAEGKRPEAQCAPKHPLFSRLGFAAPRTRFGLMLWGGVVSIACIGETVLSMQTIFVGLSGSTASSPLTGALFGGLAFFLFSLGTSMPSMAFAGLGAGMAQREKRQKLLLQAERISGALMIAFGAMLVSVMLILR